MKELYYELMVYAALVSGYPMPDVLPDVYFVEQEFFNETICQGIKKCSIVGWYIDQSDAEKYKEVKHQDVYINNIGHQFSTEFTNSVIVHEFVHFNQDLAGLMKRNPEYSDEFRLEYKAYYVQNKYLKKNRAAVQSCPNFAMCVSVRGGVFQ
ncbi:MAG: hypothetical protein FVQ79_00620 [Planctomycetes bacterium]|nr:hypothetical protein [Planctomycetota bacterium]